MGFDEPIELDPYEIGVYYGRQFEPILKTKEQALREDRVRKQKQGLREFEIGGEIIYALNRKNAWRKYINIHKERIKKYRFLNPKKHKTPKFNQLEYPITLEEAFKQKES